MTSPQADDVNRAIVRAWRDPEYAASLSAETRDAMPGAPENADSYTDEQLVEFLNDGLRMPLSDDQLAVAAGAGSNGTNYNQAYSQGEANGFSSDQAQLAANNTVGNATSWG